MFFWFLDEIWHNIVISTSFTLYLTVIYYNIALISLSFRFNFSEAAVLLQSSFQLFSKKVDRLYDQVQEACHGTTTKKKGRKAGNAEQNEDELAMKKSDFDMEVDTADLARNMVDVAWLLEQGKKKENKLPVKVGQIRTEGQRDRLVDLPISFMPTKKTAPSKHFLKFEQNNDTIFVRQDELFSFSSCAYASNNAEMVSYSVTYGL